MTRDHATMTQVTIVQLRAQLVLRRLRRHESLTEADRCWLEHGMAELVAAAHQLAAVLADEPAVGHGAWERQLRRMRPLLPADRLLPN